MENTETLLSRLNPYCARAIESAANLCQIRTHAEILPEHWLLKLLALGDGDLTVVARNYQWNMDEIWQALLNWLDNQPRLLCDQPQLSESIKLLIQAAWLRASLTGDSEIRSVHVLMAIRDNPELTQCEGFWYLHSLTQVQLESIRPLLDRESDERPEHQPAHRSDFEAAAVMPVTTIADNHKPHAELQITLDNFTRDITAKAKAGDIVPVVGRDT